MIIVNLTLSFADNLQQSALEWIKQEYIPLLKACPSVTSSDLFQVNAQQGADDCFALQIRFNNEESFSLFEKAYQNDFESALFAKFTNQFGMFKTILRSI